MGKKLEVLALVAGVVLLGASTRFIQDSLSRPSKENYVLESEFKKAEETYHWNDLVGRSLLTVGAIGTLYGSILMYSGRRK